MVGKKRLAFAGTIFILLIPLFLAIGLTFDRVKVLVSSDRKQASVINCQFEKYFVTRPSLRHPGFKNVYKTPLYHPVILLRGEKNKSESIILAETISGCTYKYQGKTVSIFYDRVIPSNSRLAGFRHFWMPPLGFFVVSLFCGVLALYLSKAWFFNIHARV